MDNKMTMKTESGAKLDSAEIAKSSKHKISFSSSSSSSESIDLEKNQIVLETIRVEEEKEQVLATTTQIESKHKENASISSQGSSTMVVPGGGAYDSNRIPASVFTSKPGTPMEWSVASNESLFSIHMGNTSFSRDHVFMLYRSGEMPKFDFDQPMNPFSGANTPPIPPEYIERKSIEVAVNNADFTIEREKFAQPELPVFNAKSVPLDHEKIVFPEKTVSVHGDEIRTSVSSTHSFKFPLLEVGGASMKDNMHSPKRTINEKVEAQPTKSQPETLPKAASTPAKRSTWLSFFSCCSPTTN